MLGRAVGSAEGEAVIEGEASGEPWPERAVGDPHPVARPIRATDKHQALRRLNFELRGCQTRFFADRYVGPPITTLWAVQAHPDADAATVAALSAKIRDIPDFPRQGILFKDVTTLLMDSAAFRQAVDLMAETYRGKTVDLVVGVESRGFIFGGALAYQLGAGFVPVRKEGKLPSQKLRESYQLEYGSAVLEIHKDAIQPGQPVVIVDDLLATGGTARATARLVQQLGGKVVGISFLIELRFLDGIKNLAEYDVVSHIKF